jgi:hypothetical protein
LADGLQVASHTRRALKKHYRTEGAREGRGIIELAEPLRAENQSATGKALDPATCALE